MGKALPKSPRKQAAIVKKLAKQFGLELKAKEAEKIPTALEILIVKFYESDSISRQQPGKKDFVTVRGHDGKKERVQKKILMTTVMEAFKQFKVEHPEIHTVYCCVYHENFEMVLTGIRKVQNVPQPDELVKAAACNWCLDCYLGKCDECADVEKKVEPVFKVESDSTVGDVDCPYFQWNYENKKTSVASTLAEAQREARKQLAVMKRHRFIAKTQLHQMRTLKQSLGDVECVIQEDFAENFNIKQQDEVMSAHCVTNGVTLFTAVLNTKEGAKSYVVVSDDLHHDKFAVTAFNRAILADAAECGIPLERLHFFSDGAGSQFKNRFTLSILLRPTLLHRNVQEVDWSFYGTAHGKGPVDGVGGTVNRAVWRRILQGKVTISTPHEFVAVAKEACPNVTIVFIDAAQVATTRQELESLWAQNRPQRIPNTRQAHYFKPTSPSSMQVGPVSPFGQNDVCVWFREAQIFLVKVRWQMPRLMIVRSLWKQGCSMKTKTRTQSLFKLRYTMKVRSEMLRLMSVRSLWKQGCSMKTRTQSLFKLRYTMKVRWQMPRKMRV